jgi:hypothetical protein
VDQRRVTTLGVAATLIVAGCILYLGLVLAPRLTVGCGGCPPPQAGAFAIGTPTNDSLNGVHWYNFTVASASRGVSLGAIHWQFITARGTVISPASNWTMTVLNSTGTVVGSCDLVTGIWTLGDAMPLTVQMKFSIYSADTILSGDHAAVSDSAAYSGSITVNIP